MTILKHQSKQQSRPTVPCDGPRMNPSVDVGNPPRPFRHLRMTERRTPDPSSSRVPVHSALVQKSVTAITNPAGRLSIWMLGKTHALGKWKTANSWQTICNQSNPASGFRRRVRTALTSPYTGSQSYRCILGTRDHPRALGQRNSTPEVKAKRCSSIVRLPSQPQQFWSSHT
jgi:hypothetical protein